MIEPAAIPILLKAVDFLFGEGSKILQERREQRKAEQKIKTAEHGTPQSPHSGKPEPTIESKEDALQQRISESAWLAAEKEIEHLMTLLEIYSKNYYLAKEQYAMWQPALVPAIIVHNLSESEDGIADTMKKLQATLSRVYGREVINMKGEQA